MPSALIWSVESVLLGLWALVLSSFSTPLHCFVARCHVLISVCTMVLHLFVVSRGFVVGSAVSQAFVCAVSALFLTYLFAVLATGADPRLFKMPSVGLLQLDAVIGLSWFAVAVLSGLGMALSFVTKDRGAPQSGKTFLMLHPCGVHLLVIFPCWAVIRTARSDYSGLLFSLAWVLCVGNMAVELSGTDFPSLALRMKEKASPLFGGVLVFLACTTYLFRFSAVAVSTSALFLFDINTQQRALVFCLVGVAVISSLGTLTVLMTDIFPSVQIFQNMAAVIKQLDNFFQGRIENEPPSPADIKQENPQGIQSKILGASMTSHLRFALAPTLPPPRFSSTSDPAAVSIRKMA
jgi:hypothetical protein